MQATSNPIPKPYAQNPMYLKTWPSVAQSPEISPSIYKSTKIPGAATLEDLQDVGREGASQRVQVTV